MEPESPTIPPPEKQSKTTAILLIILVMIIAVVAVGVLIYRSNHNKKTATSKTNQATQATGTPEDGSKQTEAELRNFKDEATVNVTAEGPSPQTLNIAPGTKIIWQNKDSKSHQLAINPGSTVPNQFYNNRVLAAGDGYPFVINQTGTFHYHYVDNPTINGTIVVK